MEARPASHGFDWYPRTMGSRTRTHSAEPQTPSAPEQLSAGALEPAPQMAVGRVAHFEALERGLTPRQRETEADEHEQAPEPDAPCVVQAGAGHGKAHAAPHRPRQAVAARAIDRELHEDIVEQARAACSHRPGRSPPRGRAEGNRDRPAGVSPARTGTRSATPSRCRYIPAHRRPPRCATTDAAACRSRARSGRTPRHQFEHGATQHHAAKRRPGVGEIHAPVGHPDAPVLLRNLDRGRHHRRKRNSRNRHVGHGSNRF